MLRIQLNSLCLEKQALAAENARLRDEHQDRAALIDWEAQQGHYWEKNGQLKQENDNPRQEMERLKQLYEQLLRDTEAE